MTNSANTPAASSTVDAKTLHLREVKKHASRRCRTRAKMIAAGQTLTPDLAIRSLQPKAMRFENFKIETETKAVRLNRNGGNAVAVVIVEKSDAGTQKSRKSFKNMHLAAKEFKKALK